MIATRVNPASVPTAGSGASARVVAVHTIIMRALLLLVYLAQPSTAGNFASPIECSKELDEWFERTLSNEATNMTVLDVGGGTGDKTKRLRSRYNGPNRTSLTTWHSFECIQPGVSKRTDTCSSFDGRHIPRADNSIDIIFYSYVLHHAGGNTIALLQETRRVARRYIVVLEDLQYDTSYAARTEVTHPGW